jgi:predicted nuclease with RNAse H fold
MRLNSRRTHRPTYFCPSVVRGAAELTCGAKVACHPYSCCVKLSPYRLECVGRWTAPTVSICKSAPPAAHFAPVSSVRHCAPPKFVLLIFSFPRARDLSRLGQSVVHPLRAMYDVCLTHECHRLKVFDQREGFESCPALALCFKRTVNAVVFCVIVAMYAVLAQSA